MIKIKDKREKFKKLRSTFYVLRSSGGFTLLFASLVAAVLLSLGLAIFNITFKELILSSTISESQEAFAAADAGVECALFWDLEHPGYSASIFGGDTQSIVPQGLVAYWRLDEDSGTTASDSAGNNDGTLVNMDPSTDWVTGKVGGALELGPGEEVSVTDNGSLDLEVYTYSFWIYPQELPTGSWRQVMIKGNGPVNGGRSPGVWLRPNDMGLHIAHSTSNGSQNGINATSPIAAYGWTHVAITSTGDGGVIRSYINGVPDVSQNITNGTDLIANDYPFKMGRGATTADMVLDDVRVYNRVLSTSEIKTLYNATESSVDGPVGQASGLTCNSEDITDPSTGWDSTSGWSVTSGSGSDVTVIFDILFNDNTCATVTVDKMATTTEISSRGYNTCLDVPRRVERGLRVRY